MNEVFKSGFTPFSSCNYQKGNYGSFPALSEKEVMGFDSALMELDCCFLERIREKLKMEG